MDRTFTVTSDNLVVAPKGETVTEDQLAGCNVDALVAGGHLQEQKKAKAADKGAE